MIRVESVHYRYTSHGAPPVLALQGVNAEFHRGQLTVLFGHNGCGKSTLARHLNVLLRAASGDVWVDELNTRDRGRVWEIRRRVGMVFQNPDNQIVASPVEDDIAFGVENLGVEPREMQSRIDEVLALLDLQDLRDREPHLLSGGQKQLVSIAGVLAMRPDYLVLDEPTSLLGPDDRQAVLGVVERLAHESGLGVILITHHMDEAVRADRVLVMEAGRVVLHGTPREVFSQVELVRNLKLDVPPITQVAFELRSAHGLAIRPDTLTLDELLAQVIPQLAPAPWR
ncbi:MAG TPA: energy-coupling factor transporter ATPase [Actinomycetota bacterium]|nr:energy-coupling factor transporter ATPase [Actinomycetota bacterium]